MKKFINLGIVVAVAKNYAIGRDNQMLWHLPNDFKHFREITSGHSVIMGRKTFESIGKVLPNRKNIVISRGMRAEMEGVIWAKNLEDAVEMCMEDGEIFVIGGGQIYAQALPFCTTIYLTMVNASFEGDSFFPEIDSRVWEKQDEVHHLKDEKHAYNYSFSTWKRKCKNG